MKILHIGPDSKFTQFLGRKFEEIAPGASTFVALTHDVSVKNPVIGASNLPARPASADFFSKIIPLGIKADAIIAHGMTREALVLMTILRKPIKVWSGWGFDYYDTDADKLLAPLTREYAKEHSGTNRRSFPKTLINGAIHRLRNRVVSRLDYFSAPIPSDFDVMRNSFPSFKGDYLQLNYGDVITMFSAGIESNAGGNILVGNSSSLTNNHADVFARISECDLAGRKVIVPLSYGDEKYREYVLYEGTKYFGDAFLPLVDFIPLDEYVRLVSTCGVVIMGHRRQQALGNIGAALYHGAHVYLDKECPTFSFMKARGAHVWYLEDLGRTLPTGGLDESLTQDNRAVLEEFWGINVVSNNIARCVDSIAKSMST